MQTQISSSEHKLRITLSSEQSSALDHITTWFRQCRLVASTNALKGIQEFKLGGYAGTGKTTMIRHIITELRVAVAVCAFTGKAAFVLKRKGIPASTIHSLIYKPEVDDKTKEVTFILRQPEDLQIDLIIVDEASMVSHELYHDLKTFNKPILFVGDPGQLEPIGDNPNLMKVTDFTLSTIHRQALDSPIIGLATEIRTKGQIYDPRKFGTHEGLVFQTKVLKPEVIYAVDQVICALNKTRAAVNAKFRHDKGFGNFDGLHVGEKLICLKNDSTLGVFNGQIMYVHEIREERPLWYDCVVEYEGIDGKHRIPIWSEPFYRELHEKDRPPKLVAKCDFGYCITCHKAQGSEWDRVLVVDEWMGRVWDMARWRYTAVTRASKELNYAM